MQNLVRKEVVPHSTYKGDLSLAITKVPSVNQIVVEHYMVVEGGIFIAKYYPEEVDFKYKCFDGTTVIEYHKENRSAPCKERKIFGLTLSSLYLSSSIEHNGKKYKYVWSVRSTDMAFFRNEINSDVMHDLRSKIFNRQQLKLSKDFLWELLLPVLNPLLKDLKVITS